MRFRSPPIVAAARRALFALAMLGAAPALAGPGAPVAAIALLTAEGHAHHVTVQRDAGHDDIVICHDGAASAALLGPSLSRDCEDPGDHRLHVTRADRMTPRGDAKSDLRHAPAVAFALVAAALENPAPRSSARAPLAEAAFAPPPLARTGILLL